MDERDLTVEIKSILMTASNNSVDLLNNSISAYIDSTVPYFYLVNDTLHEYLQAQNATVVFSISNTTQSVNISLPYAAFDLIAEYPLVSNTTRYFPLMRATNESQYTLGRAFLQET